MIDLTFRSFSRARWVTLGTNRGILDASGNTQPGFCVDEIGNAALTSATYNNLGAVITPAVIDTWYWINLRVHGQSVAADTDVLFAGEVEDGFKFTKSKLAASFRNTGTVTSITIEGQPIKAYEIGTANNRIQLLDPRPYAALRWRERLGGMSF